MIRIRWMQPAVEDLERISAYVELRDSVAMANRICRALYDAVQFVSRFPESGRVGVEEDTREWVVPALSSYLIVYRVRKDEVIEILRIWHGAQQR